MMNHRIRYRIWVDKKEKPFLGKGRIILLENIDKTGSINQAAKEMKMSYRQAWQLIKDMNELSEAPLIEKNQGGKNGGGSRLTDKGRQLIEEFYRMEEEIQRFVDQKIKEFNF